MRLVKLALNVLGAFLLLLGFVWILQGMNILPGSFMTGEPMWAAAGAVVALGALAFLHPFNGPAFPFSFPIGLWPMRLAGC
jgi:hypothetical protein